MLRVRNVFKHYESRNGRVPVLHNISLTIDPGEFCALTGASGSGKTTLLNLLGLLDMPSCGSIELDGCQLSGLKPNQAAKVRNSVIGFVFQSFHLLPHLTAAGNVGLPLVYRGFSKTYRRERAFWALDQTGLLGYEERLPEELSGGQRQRVAIARALVGNPSILLADEPTGNLDSQSADEIMSLFLRINAALGVTVLMVTHDPAMSARCARRVVMRDGRIADANSGHPRSVEVTE